MIADSIAHLYWTTRFCDFLILIYVIQKLEEYQRIENELQQRIEQLEKRQSQDTTVLNIVNRYWNHLNDDVKTMLLEFDDECQNVADESKSTVFFKNNF